jgi:hypothetical protein
VTGKNIPQQRSLAYSCGIMKLPKDRVQDA